MLLEIFRDEQSWHCHEKRADLETALKKSWYPYFASRRKYSAFKYMSLWLHGRRFRTDKDEYEARKDFLCRVEGVPSYPGPPRLGEHR